MIYHSLFFTRFSLPFRFNLFAFLYRHYVPLFVYLPFKQIIHLEAGNFFFFSIFSIFLRVTNFPKPLFANLIYRNYFLVPLKCSIECMPGKCITVWYASCSAESKIALQRIINIAQKLIGCSLASVNGITNSRRNRAKIIMKDNSLPRYQLFELLRSVLVLFKGKNL